jgi:hypothetical protein
VRESRLVAQFRLFSKSSESEEMKLIRRSSLDPIAGFASDLHAVSVQPDRLKYVKRLLVALPVLNKAEVRFEGEDAPVDLHSHFKR